MIPHEVGDVVRDRARSQTGEVIAVNGDVLTLVRPSGLTWNTPQGHCKNATDEEKRELQTNRANRLRLGSGVRERGASRAQQVVGTELP